VALVESAYRGDASRSGWTTEADLLDGQRTDAEAVAAMVADADGCVLLAETADGELVGCCRIERLQSRAHFGMFAVDPMRQAERVGSRLLTAAEDLARSWASAEMELTVIAQRAELIAWYERRGYRPTGETRPFPYGDERFGKPRRDDLHFVVLTKALTDG